MSRHIAAYVPEEEAEEWEEKASEMGMSLSEWVIAMTRAGQKPFGREVMPDQSRDDLRQKQNDLRRELQRARDRIEELEEIVHTSEREAILDYVEENPGAEYQNIVQYVVNSANSRVTKILDQMEGAELKIDDNGQMYTNSD